MEELEKLLNYSGLTYYDSRLKAWITGKTYAIEEKLLQLSAATDDAVSELQDQVEQISAHTMQLDDAVVILADNLDEVKEEVDDHEGRLEEVEAAISAISESTVAKVLGEGYIITGGTSLEPVVKIDESLIADSLASGQPDEALVTLGAVKDLGSALHYKGIVDELPAEGEPGDVVILHSGDTYTEYIFDGEEWQQFGNEGIYATKVEVEELSGATKAIEEEVEKQGEQIAELSAETASLDSRLDEVEQELSASTADLENRMDDAEEAISDLDDRLSALTEEVNEKVESVEEADEYVSVEGTTNVTVGLNGEMIQNASDSHSGDTKLATAGFVAEQIASIPHASDAEIALKYIDWNGDEQQVGAFTLDQQDDEAIQLFETIDQTDINALFATEVATLEELEAAFANAQDKDVIKLTADIEGGIELNRDVELTLDLNGRKINAGTDDGIDLKQGKLTIVGDGTVETHGAECCAIWARGGSVVIKSGEFISDDNKEATIYVSDANSKIEILGGTFNNVDSDPYVWKPEITGLTLNVHNSLATAETLRDKLVVYGGTFNNDPALGDENLGGTFVADGYKSEKVGDMYVVSKE